MAQHKYIEVIRTSVKSDHQARIIGRGRSGVVYLEQGRSNRDAATVCKVFGGDTASRLVLYALTGAPNPYVWCEAAVRSAESRRRILSVLVRYWFKGRLRLPETFGVVWDESHKAYGLRCGFVSGTHAPLRLPHWRSKDEEFVDDLVKNIMRPLQRHLMLAGFDGLIWQAGLGNPVAANNFMLEHSTPKRPCWVWIDLESGVPALFPMNPLALLRYYLPLSWRHRGWLFDDVDTEKLRQYVKEHQEAMALEYSRDELVRLNQCINELERDQAHWKSLPRHHRSIGYAHRKGRITEEEAEWFKERPLRWTVKLWLHLLLQGVRKVHRILVRAIVWLRDRNWLRLMGNSWLFATSQRFRTFFARRYVTRRIQSWRARGFLRMDAVNRLRNELRGDEASDYLTDFGVHLAIKPPVKAIQWWIVPGLFAAGVIQSGVVTVAILLGGGAIARTLYTTGRIIQSVLSRQRAPWLALGIGVLPVVGNAAYPAQLIYHGTKRGCSIARFILYDTFARIGQHFPIWGGQDTLTEHWFNRLPDVFFGYLDNSNY